MFFWSNNSRKKLALKDICLCDGSGVGAHVQAMLCGLDSDYFELSLALCWVHVAACRTQIWQFGRFDDVFRTVGKHTRAKMPLPQAILQNAVDTMRITRVHERLGTSGVGGFYVLLQFLSLQKMCNLQVISAAVRCSI